MLCTNKTQHDLDRLMLVQIIPGDILEETAAMLDDYVKENSTVKTEDSTVKMTEIINKVRTAYIMQAVHRNRSPQL